jgi:hypothetical protein
VADACGGIEDFFPGGVVGDFVNDEDVGHEGLVIEGERMTAGRKGVAQEVRPATKITRLRTPKM